jgi:hypothetical protein
MKEDACSAHSLHYSLFLRRSVSFLEFGFLPILVAAFLLASWFPLNLFFGIPPGWGVIPAVVINFFWGYKRYTAWIKYNAQLAEEWFGTKPVLSLLGSGVTYERGGEPIFVPWHCIEHMAFQRRIPMWRTGGHLLGAPLAWFSLGLRIEGTTKLVQFRPWQIQGGVMALWRFKRLADRLKSRVTSVTGKASP